jgi:serine protease AprX
MVGGRRAAVAVAMALVAAGAVGAAAGGAQGPADESVPAELADHVGATPTPVLAVHERDAEPDAVRTQLEDLGVEFTMLERVGVTQVLVPHDALGEVAGLDGVADLYPDEELELHLDEAAPLVRAPTAWDELGTTGTGSTVLVIDTGVDGLHPDLVDRVVESAQPHDPLETGLVPGGYTEGVPANDVNGHGTHVSGIVAGTGFASGPADPNHERYRGIAHGAELVSWAIPGLGNASSVFQAVQGFEYALENRDRFGIDVVTNSYGTPGEPDPGHPLNVASKAAYEAGMAVVFAAGNGGERAGKVELNRYSTVPWTISVAATDSQGQRASFSSSGLAPTELGTYWEHPDVAAQGDGVMAAKSRTGATQAYGPLYQPSSEQDPVGTATHYQNLDGTSMSAPAVAGVLALMYDANPDLSPAQAYDLLLGTARDADAPYWRLGVGVADAAAAVEAAGSTDGQLDDFLAADEVPYTDASDPLDDPARALLAGAADERADAAELERWLEDGTDWPVYGTGLLGWWLGTDRGQGAGVDNGCVEATVPVPDAATDLELTLRDHQIAPTDPDTVDRTYLNVTGPGDEAIRVPAQWEPDLTFPDPTPGTWRVQLDPGTVAVESFWALEANLEGGGAAPDEWTGPNCTGT